MTSDTPNSATPNSEAPDSETTTELTDTVHAGQRGAPRRRSHRGRRIVAVTAGIAMVPALYAAASAVTGGTTTPKAVSVAAGADDPATHTTETEVEHGVVTTKPHGGDQTTPTTPTTPATTPSTPPATIPDQGTEIEVEHGVVTTKPHGGDDDASPAPAPAPVSQAFASAGGTIEVTLADGALSLTSSSPASGFTAEVHDNRPDRVEVRFFGTDGNEWRIRVEVAQGQLVSEITNHG